MTERRDTQDQAEFREYCRRWLDENRPPAPPFRLPILPIEVSSEEQRQYLCAWQKKCHAAGLVGTDYPKEYGGHGHKGFQSIASQEMGRAGVPFMINVIGLGMAAPTILVHGTEEQKRRFLPPLLSGEEIWCQGFSEPGAGSDLAAARTRAELRGDVFHVTGQKIWTSYARFADWCILLVRTDPNAPKHKGLTFLLLDMRTPGITIRPLVEMTGVAWFNEVFFDDVRVPASRMIGRLNEGWTIAITTLSHERGGSAPHARLAAELRDMIGMARGRGATGDPRVRQALAQSWVETEIVRLVAYRQVSEVMRKGQPGPEGSYLKLLWSESDMRMKELGIALEGPYATIDRGDAHAVDGGRWQYEYLWSRAASIYAGTSEVQRNIIAQRVLGLPRG